MLKQLLITTEDLPGSEFSSSFNFRKNWLSLYTFAQRIRTNNYYRHCWQLLLCGLVFPTEKVPLEQLLLLHAVAVHPDDFPETPAYSYYFFSIDNAPNEDLIIASVYQRYLEFFKHYQLENYTRNIINESDCNFINRSLAVKSA